MIFTQGDPPRFVAERTLIIVGEAQMEIGGEIHPCGHEQDEWEELFRLHHKCYDNMQIPDINGDVKWIEWHIDIFMLLCYPSCGRIIR